MPGRVFQKADESVMDLMRQVIEKHHPDLTEADVRIGVVMVTPPTDKAGTPTAPAILHHGAAAAGRIRLVAIKDRLFKKIDAEIELALNRWAELPDASRVALLDHELTHLRVVREKTGAVRMADDLRPVLRLIPDDWQLTGFAAIAGRHGWYSLEVQSFHHLYEVHEQLLFPWVESVKKPDFKRLLKQAVKADRRMQSAGATVEVS